MPLYGPSTATATVAANTNVVTITGMDLNAVVQQGMTINLGARDRAVGDAWIINTVVPNGTNGGTITTAGSIPTAYNSAPFLIDTRGFNGTDSSFAAAVSLKLLATLTNLLGTATNLFAGSRQLVLDKVANTAIGRIAFAIAGRTWGDLAQRQFAYTPTGGQAATVETLAVRAFPDGATPTDAILVNLANGGVDTLATESFMQAASMVDLGSAPDMKTFINGSGTISSFGPAKNKVRFVIFSGSCTLVHSSALILPTFSSIVTQPGDTLIAASGPDGAWRVRHYQRSSGKALVAPSAAEQGYVGNAGTNHITLPNGMRMQWGLYTGPLDDVIVLFPISFNATVLSISATPYIDLGFNQIVSCAVSTQTLTSFRLSRRAFTSGQPAPIDLSVWWLAIGY